MYFSKSIGGNLKYLVETYVKKLRKPFREKNGEYYKSSIWEHSSPSHLSKRCISLIIIFIVFKWTC
jgi:hypothetical protein